MLRLPSWIPGSGTINAFFEWVEGVFTSLWDWIDWLKGQLTDFYQGQILPLWSWIDWIKAQLVSIQRIAEVAIAIAQAATTQITENTLQFITNVYNTTTENITNVYRSVNETINNVYETVNNITQNTYTTILGVTEEAVRAVIDSALAPFAPLLSFYAVFGGPISDFFSDPGGYIMAHLEALAEKQALRFQRMAERLLEAIW